MMCSIMNLMEKAVINSATGERIGNLCDVELDTQSASLCAIIVSVKKHSGCFISKCEKVRIDWCNISVIGHDAILVHCEGELKRISEEKSFIEKIWD